MKSLKRSVKGSVALWRLFKWRFLGFLNIDRSVWDGTANVLVVSDIKYVKVSKICIYSFLYWHPKAKINLIVDQKTKDKCSKAFYQKIKSGKVDLKLNPEIVEKPWQQTKLDLLMKICGTNEIFMDADLRWNGKMPQILGTTFYVTEFDMTKNSEYEDLFQRLKINTKKPIYMRNVSFLTFRGEINRSELERQVYETENFIRNSNYSFARMSEQIAISIAVSNYQGDIFPLKHSDERNDGQFVETCYFGATGLGF